VSLKSWLWNPCKKATFTRQTIYSKANQTKTYFNKLTDSKFQPSKSFNHCDPPPPDHFHLVDTDPKIMAYEIIPINNKFKTSIHPPFIPQIPPTPMHTCRPRSWTQPDVRDSSCPSPSIQYNLRWGKRKQKKTGFLTFHYIYIYWLLFFLGGDLLRMVYEIIPT